MRFWLRGFVFRNLAIPVRKRLVQSSSRSFFSLPLHYHRGRSTQTAPAMPLTDADRARVQAWQGAMRDAMAVIPEFDPDKVQAAREAVNMAYPISKDVLQAHSEELLTKIHEPLVLPWAPFLKPDAPWGLAVYRVSYSDDAAWDRVLSVLRRNIEEPLAMRPDQPDLSSRYDLVVMDDRSEFEGAGPEEIRKHFNRWSVDELQRNWRANRKPATKDKIIGPTSSTNDYLWQAGVRYNFCILVDDICLESLEQMGTPVLKLVRRDWAPDSEQDEDEEDEEDEKLDWEGGETNNDHEDVGWMYIEPCDYIELERQLQDDGWQDYYLRPPLMRFVDDFDKLPGFWRRSPSSADLQ